MRKLFYAGLYRLVRSKIFWLELAAMAGFSIWIVGINYAPEIQSSADRLAADDIFFTVYQLISLFLAAGVSLFVGTEYSDGTLRNKLVVGHTRGHIYGAMLLVSLLMTGMLLVLHGVITLVLGSIVLAPVQMPTSRLAFLLLVAVLDCVVFTALFTAIALNCTSKAVSAVATLLSSLAMTMLAGTLGNRLLEPEEVYDGVIATQNGFQYGERIPNPDYVDGLRRTVYEFLYDLLPSGQLMQLPMDSVECRVSWLVLSLALLAAVTAVGFCLFWKKDIR